MSKLAVNGGTPVRETKLYKPYPGAQLYDQKEAEEIMKVIMAKAPFRYYGVTSQHAVDRFEENFSKRFRVKNALGVSSGTAAVMVALKAASIGPGDKVIVPACTFIATAGAVVCAGAVPIFADIDDTMHIDPKKLPDVIDKYTKAIITVPLGGMPCQMDEIMKIAKEYNLIVIEDVAQAMGSSLNGIPMGTWGDIGAFSLQMNKILTTGEGGVVVSNDDLLYERAVRYHDQGSFRKDFSRPTTDQTCFNGQNYRMSELAGAVACAQLEKLDPMLNRMKEIKKAIKEGLSGIDGITFRRCVDEEGDASCNLTIFFPTNEKLIEFHKAIIPENVTFYSWYGGRPVYMSKSIMEQHTVEGKGFPYNQFDEKIVYTEDMCPYALDILARATTIPISSVFTDEDVEDVITAVKKVAAEIL